MAELDTTSIRRFVDLKDASFSGKSDSDPDKNSRSQLVVKRITSTDVERKINARVAAVSSQIETSMRFVRELSGRRLAHSRQSSVASEQSTSSGWRSDNLTLFNFSRNFSLVILSASFVIGSKRFLFASDAILRHPTFESCLGSNMVWSN